MPEDDPLTLAIAPPSNEKPDERRARKKEEAHARRISEKIDAQLPAEALAASKYRQPTKLLLVGQIATGNISS